MLSQSFEKVNKKNVFFTILFLIFILIILTTITYFKVTKEKMISSNTTFKYTILEISDQIKLKKISNSRKEDILTTELPNCEIKKLVKGNEINIIMDEKITTELDIKNFKILKLKRLRPNYKKSFCKNKVNY